MSQLKQDEWPEEGEPTTSETQWPVSSNDQVVARGEAADQRDADEDDVRNVRPDDAID